MKAPSALIPRNEMKSKKKRKKLVWGKRKRDKISKAKLALETPFESLLVALHRTFHVKSLERGNLVRPMAKVTEYYHCSIINYKKKNIVI